MLCVCLVQSVEIVRTSVMVVVILESWRTS